ncbi:MAG: CHAT domain-containing protein [Myxococcales bacterium]|nr:CHAT domain-containing protein [Myxococcales bacterium]
MVDIPTVLMLASPADRSVATALREQICRDSVLCRWLGTPAKSWLQRSLLTARLHQANRLLLVVSRRFFQEFASFAEFFAAAVARRNAGLLEIAVVLVEPLAFPPSELGQLAQRLPSNRYPWRDFGWLQAIARELRRGLRLVRPIRDVLCIYACPEALWNSGVLRLDLERRQIEEANRFSGMRLRIRDCWAARPSDVGAHLRAGPVDVLHFAGHGEPGGILLEHEYDRHQAQLVAIAPLLRMLQNYQPRCLVLNACWSASALLANQGIPYVIAMEGQANDDGAAFFARSFYQVLADTNDVEFAFDHARGLLDMTHGGGCRPRLFYGRGGSRGMA